MPHCDLDAYGNRNCHCDCHAYGNINTKSEAHTIGATSPNASASSVTFVYEEETHCSIRKSDL